MNTVPDDQNISPCPHFDACGGCDLWHLEKDIYKAEKQKIISEMLTRLNLPTHLQTKMISIGPGQRRRVALKVAVNKGEIKIGFFERKSHEVVNVEKCLVASDKINNFIAPLKNHLSKLKKPGNIYEISITELDHFFDVIITFKNKPISKDLATLSTLANEKRIARLYWRTKNEKEHHHIFEQYEAKLSFDGISVDFPLGGFLQATQKAQDQIIDLICNATQKDIKIADLFSGCGTYSFPLLKHGKTVSSYESNRDMVTAMNNALRRENLENHAKTYCLDLWKKPLNGKQLDGFDAAIINPPRAGAQTQIKHIAQSNIPKLIMISCNPKSFEDDARILLEHGFKMSSITAIDQFYRSKHLELASVFLK